MCVLTLIFDLGIKHENMEIIRNIEKLQKKLLVWLRWESWCIDQSKVQQSAMEINDVYEAWKPDSCLCA